MADYAFLLDEDNLKRWESTFCTVLGCDVQSAVKAHRIERQHIEAFNALMKHAPSVPDFNTRLKVKSGLVNMLTIALSGEKGKFQGTAEQLDAFCEWFESGELPAGDK